MGIEIRQRKTFDTTGGLTTAPFNVAFDSDVLAGSLLIVAGVSYNNVTYSYSTLNSVSDTRSNSWSTPINVYTANWSGIWLAHTTAASSAGAATLTLTMQATASLRIGMVAFEVTGANTSDPLDTYETGTSNANSSSVTTATTGALSQANNLLIGFGGGAFGVPGDTADWTNEHAVNNGGTRIGTKIMSRVVSSTAGVSVTINHESTTNYRHAMVAVFKEALGGSRLAMMGCGR